MSREPHRDLPSLARLRADLLRTQLDPGHGRRGRSRRAVLITIALLVPSVAATAAITRDGPARDDTEVRWVSAAEGTDPTVGRFEIFRDKADPGCYGISLPDEDLPGVARAIAGTCVENPRLHVSFINRTAGGTFAYGVASEDVQKVTLGGAGVSPRPAQLFDGPSGTRYFVVSYSERIPRAQVTATDGDGAPVGQQTAPE